MKAYFSRSKFCAESKYAYQNFICLLLVPLKVKKVPKDQKT